MNELCASENSTPLFNTFPTLTDGIGPCGLPVRPVHQFIAAYLDLLPIRIHVGAAFVLARHEHGNAQQAQAKGCNLKTFHSTWMI